MIVQNSTHGVESQLEYIINKGLNRLVCTNKNRNKSQYLKSKRKSQKTKTKNARLNKQSGKHPEQKDPISLSRRQSLASVQPVLTKVSTDQALETFQLLNLDLKSYFLKRSLQS
ncbi:hypothetical protein [Vibrio lentus]|uniref:hypothetical protein n=1 Tax=Vibrio lentus TaxID=136468 RepID=UPI000C846AE4|nr:hypothetical protein [Vibrio lentus]PMG21117.1 hypothetical protein BCU96_21415 [Vibrio lentus]PMH05679.1 hypothetical protein BCU76_10035 [Vibrio lentus]PMI90014.1 hypothetical protein BCU35_05030 [Vibrio lentus]PMK92103.1 hypothetical protein BCT89_22235 [Vibrio lentus]PMN17984.1 hypothetical protein BCT39_04955 [Vibrio lentus]